MMTEPEDLGLRQEDVIYLNSIPRGHDTRPSFHDSPQNRSRRPSVECEVARVLAEIDPNYVGLNKVQTRHALRCICERLYAVLHARYPGDDWTNDAFVSFA